MVLGLSPTHQPMAGTPEALKRYPKIVPNVPAFDSGDLLKVERSANLLRQAASELESTASQVVADQRIHSLAVLRTELVALQSSLQHLKVEVAALRPMERPNQQAGQQDQAETP